MRAVANVAQRTGGQLGLCLVVALTAPLIFLAGCTLVLWVAGMFTTRVEARAALVMLGVAVLASVAMAMASAWAAHESRVLAEWRRSVCDAQQAAGLAPAAPPPPTVVNGHEHVD